MTDEKISELASATSIDGTELLPLAKGGATVHATLAALLAGVQPLDSDLTAISALATTAFGRSLLTLADAAAGRTALALGTAAVRDAGAVNGVASLDGAGTIPDAQIPAAITRDSELSAAIAALVNSAPGTLDTLAEIATALGNDPNLATTLTNAIAAKVAKAGDTMTGQLATPSLAVTGKNALSPRTLVGRKTTAGAPTTGTWAVDDEVEDSAGVKWRCTVAGTPGTWVSVSATSASLDPGGLGLPVTFNPAAVHAAVTVPDGANRGVYCRVIGPTTTITKIRVVLGASSGNICVAVYDSSGSGVSAVPANRLATSGSVASPGTGAQDIALGSSISVQAGYWFYLGADNVTATFYRSLVGSTGLTAFAGGVSMKEATFPAPAAATPVAADRQFFLIGIP